MSEYIAPLREMHFVLEELAGLSEVADLPGCEDFSAELAGAILEEGSKFASGVLAPLNRVGDREGAQLSNGQVRTPTGWQAAYHQYCEAGWTTVSADQAYGGQGLPGLLSCALNEMWKSANMAFSLCPMLTNGAIAALSAGGPSWLCERFLPRMVSGEWTGTMNLTEPQAGSDLSAVRARAEPQADGSYRIFGQKIFITYGEHDLAENIIHLVLARLPNAPEGVKGISLFAVPKFLVDDSGALGGRNDVRCLSLEHKLGIHASPTCVMSYGDGGGALGYLVGQPNEGLALMFVMMNEARFAVGLEGVALAERATQRALAFARERVQGYDAGQRGGERVPIVSHPDVRRMLLRMKAQTEAMRTLAYVVAAQSDIAHRHADEATRQHAQAFVDLMIPVVKGWCTETSIDVASLGIQVHGGMGYIEETGAAQYLRDARITTIYEGTTAIQANDFVGRKIARDKGAAIRALIAEMEQVAAQCMEQELQETGRALKRGSVALQEAVSWLLDAYAHDIRSALAGAVPLVMLTGCVAGGWQLARAALAAKAMRAEGRGDPAFLNARIEMANVYALQIMTAADGLAQTVMQGSAIVAGFDEAMM